MTSMKLSYIATSKIQNADYCCIITGISKSEPTKLLLNIGLSREVKLYKK